MDDVLDFFFELFLELFADGLFALIRKYVQNKLLRGVLYVVSVLVIAGLVIGLMVLAVKLVSGVFPSVGNVFG